MTLSKNDQKVVDTLRAKRLHYLVKPFKQLVQSKINVHKMRWKSLLDLVYNGDRSELENGMISFLAAAGIVVSKKVRVDTRSSKDRMKKSRDKKKALGYKTISVDLDPGLYNRLERYKKKYNLTYAELLDKLVPVVL